MENIKEININNSFDDMIDIENLYPELLKLEKKTHKNIGIYYSGYITIKISKYVNIHSVNPLYIIIGEVAGSFE